MSQAINDKFPNLQLNCKVSRIYRDARRLYGRGPYKDHLWFGLRRMAPSEGRSRVLFRGGPGVLQLRHGLLLGKGKHDGVLPPCDRRRPPAADRAGRAPERAEHLRARGAGLCPAEGNPGALLSPWYNKRVLDLSCVRAHDDLLFSPALTDELVRGFGFLLPYYDYLEAVTRREDA